MVTPHPTPLLLPCMLKPKNIFCVGLNLPFFWRPIKRSLPGFVNLCSLSRGLPVSVELRQHEINASDLRLDHYLIYYTHTPITPALHFQFAKFCHSFFLSRHSSGKSIPTLLAVSRTFSSSSIDIPGLYLSKSVAYILCALVYWIYCSVSSICIGVELEEIVLRMRCWIGEGVESGR